MKKIIITTILILTLISSIFAFEILNDGTPISSFTEEQFLQLDLTIPNMNPILLSPTIDTDKVTFNLRHRTIIANYSNLSEIVSYDLYRVVQPYSISKIEIINCIDNYNYNICKNAISKRIHSYYGDYLKHDLNRVKKLKEDLLIVSDLTILDIALNVSQLEEQNNTNNFLE